MFLINQFCFTHHSYFNSSLLNTSVCFLSNTIILFRSRMYIMCDYLLSMSSAYSSTSFSAFIFLASSSTFSSASFSALWKIYLSVIVPHSVHDAAAIRPHGDVHVDAGGRSLSLPPPLPLFRRQRKPGYLQNRLLGLVFRVCGRTQSFISN